MLVVIVVLRAFSEISSQSECYNIRGWTARASFSRVFDPQDRASPEIDTFLMSTMMGATTLYEAVYCLGTTGDPATTGTLQIRIPSL